MWTDDQARVKRSHQYWVWPLPKPEEKRFPQSLVELLPQARVERIIFIKSFILIQSPIGGRGIAVSMTTEYDS